MLDIRAVKMSLPLPAEQVAQETLQAIQQQVPELSRIQPLPIGVAIAAEDGPRGLFLAGGQLGYQDEDLPERLDLTLARRALEVAIAQLRVPTPAPFAIQLLAQYDHDDIADSPAMSQHRFRQDFLPPTLAGPDGEAEPLGVGWRFSFVEPLWSVELRLEPLYQPNEAGQLDLFYVQVDVAARQNVRLEESSQMAERMAAQMLGPWSDWITSYLIGPDGD